MIKRDKYAENIIIRECGFQFDLLLFALSIPYIPRVK